MREVMTVVLLALLISGIAYAAGEGIESITADQWASLNTDAKANFVKAIKTTYKVTIDLSQNPSGLSFANGMLTNGEQSIQLTAEGGPTIIPLAQGGFEFRWFAGETITMSSADAIATPDKDGVRLPAGSYTLEENDFQVIGEATITYQESQGVIKGGPQTTILWNGLRFSHPNGFTLPIHGNQANRLGSVHGPLTVTSAQGDTLAIPTDQGSYEIRARENGQFDSVDLSRGASFTAASGASVRAWTKTLVTVDLAPAGPYYNNRASSVEKVLLDLSDPILPRVTGNLRATETQSITEFDFPHQGNTYRYYALPYLEPGVDTKMNWGPLFPGIGPIPAAGPEIGFPSINILGSAIPTWTDIAADIDNPPGDPTIIFQLNGAPQVVTSNTHGWNSAEYVRAGTTGVWNLAGYKTLFQQITKREQPRPIRDQ